MEVKEETVLTIIYDSIDEINRMLPENKKIKKAIDTPLFGNIKTLDSLGIVSLIVEIETKIDESLGVSLSIAEDGFSSEAGNPFDTIGTLSNYLHMQLNG